MNEEEKQAVKNFEDLLKKHFEETSVTSANFLDGVKGIHILNIIQKQQKEIEKLKDELKEERNFSKSALETLKECVHKDKIKEKIEELEEAYEDDYIIKIMQSLL